VDDASTDETGTRARAAGVPEGVDLKVITLPTNRGKGHAVKTGVLQSSGRIVMFADSGEPIDVGVYLSSIGLESQSEGTITVDCPFTMNPGGTMLIDTFHKISDFGGNFKSSWANNAFRNRLELVSRQVQVWTEAPKHWPLPHADEVRQGLAPSWFWGSNYVLREYKFDPEQGFVELILPRSVHNRSYPFPLILVPEIASESFDSGPDEEKLMQWLRTEGIAPYMEGAYSETFNTDLRLYKAARKLLDNSVILERTTDEQIKVLTKALSWICEHPVPIDSSIDWFEQLLQTARQQSDETPYTETDRGWIKWIDALIEYAKILNIHFNWSRDRCIEKIMWDHVIRLEVDDHRFFVREYLTRALGADIEDEAVIANLIESK